MAVYLPKNRRVLRIKVVVPQRENQENLFESNADQKFTCIQETDEVRIQDKYEAVERDLFNVRAAQSRVLFYFTGEKITSQGVDFMLGTEIVSELYGWTNPKHMSKLNNKCTQHCMNNTNKCTREFEQVLSPVVD